MIKVETAVILVEDGERTIAVELALAASTKASVLHVANARDLARHIQEASPQLLVLEGPLSGANGLDTLRWLRRGGVEVPALFLCESSVEASSMRHSSAACDELRPFETCVGLESGEFAAALGTFATPATLGERWPDEGALDEYSVADLLGHTLLTGRTGTLRLDSDGTSKTIFFDQGVPVYCSSTILVENFGQMLLRRGVITEIDYHFARKIQLREGIRQGEALVKIGVLNHQSLFDHLRHQIFEKIVNSFSWKVGTFVFAEDDSFKESVTTFLINPIKVHIEGLKRAELASGSEGGWSGLRHQWCTLSPCHANVARHVQDAVSIDALAELRNPQIVADLALGQSWDRAHTVAVVTSLRDLGALAVAESAQALPKSVVFGTDRATRNQGTAPPQPRELDESEVRGLGDALWKAYLRFSCGDHFSVLGVSEEATKAEIAAAREELLELYSTERFGPLLSDPQQVRALEGVQTKIHLAADTLLHGDRRDSYIARIRSQHVSAKSERTDVLTAEEEFDAGVVRLHDDPTAALSNFNAAARLHPNEPQYHFYAGWASVLSAGDNQGRRKGIEQMTRSLAANPVFDTGYVLLARAYSDCGDPAQALKQARTALALNPSNEEANQLMNELLDQTGNAAALRSVGS